VVRGSPEHVFWDERYRSKSELWSGKPNPHLIAETSELAGGTALDVGCGEGADAIWLAERGWRVTAVDFSAVALERGARRAAAVGEQVAHRIDWVCEDLTVWAPNPGTFDLVSAQYMHLPKEPREAMIRRLAAGVAPGGTLLVVGHHPSDLQTTVPRPPMPDLFFTGGDVVALLDGPDWDVVVDAAPPREVDDPDGYRVVIRDTVLRVVRQS
jgi:SAM-dependent methyltransferase